MTNRVRRITIAVGAVIPVGGWALQDWDLANRLPARVAASSGSPLDRLPYYALGYCAMPIGAGLIGFAAVGGRDDATR